jgi:hypothetical protein
MAQQPGVSGQNVTRVEFGDDTPKANLVMVAPERWEERRSNGQVAFRFVETGRDGGRVQLHDQERDFRITVDISDNTISFRNDSGGKAVIGIISAAYASPVQAAARSAAAAPSAQGNDDDQDFDPFADPAPKPASAPKVAGGGVSVPPFVRNQQNNQSDRAAVGQAQPAQTGSPYVGPWQATYAKYERAGDGLAGPVSWAAPEIIMITSSGPANLQIHFDKSPGQSVTLQKVGDADYTGGGYSAAFAPVGDSYSLRLQAPGIGAKDFSLAKTADGTLSRDRFSQTEKDNRRGLFNQDGLAREWNSLFFSYQGPDMDLFSAERGRKIQIFKQPGATDYASDDGLNKSLPYGLRGLRTRSAASQQMETMISNAASFQKSMSYNFGGSGGDPSKAGLGINVAREESSGTDQSAGRMKSLGLARIERYVLLLDKPNIELDPTFKRDVQRLAQGAMSPAQFRQNYGTHYAAAIHFGGIGKAEKTMSTRELKDFASSSTSVSATGGAKGVSLNGGFKMSSGASTGVNSMFSRDDWNAVGGSGAMSSTGWTVGDDDTVPVRYDLRPLSDLISPIFLKDEWDSPARGTYIAARQRLEAEINQFMASQPKLPDRLMGPAIYSLTFHSIKCVNNGDEGKAPAFLYGKISAAVGGVDGTQNLTLFDTPEANPKQIDCNGGAELPIEQSVLVAGTRPGNAGAAALFLITTAGLFEDDNSFTDLDDPIAAFPPMPVNLKDWNAASSRTDIQGTSIGNMPGIAFGPDLRVRVSFKEVQ